MNIKPFTLSSLLFVDNECNFSFDWDFIQKVETSKTHVKRNIFDSKRESFVFDRKEYEDAVVMPSYRNTDQPQHFYVAEIRNDLDPTSPFPSPELYKTFSEYYTTKYGLTITNFTQPLLDVDHTSARLNLLTPRYMNQKGVALPTSSAETKKARRENLQQKQILVAELCEIHVFPASLWKKAVCLPTILYRINYLLVAEEIRIKISNETGIGLMELPEDFRFQPLDFGFEITDGTETKPDTEESDDSDICSPESFKQNGESPNSEKGSSEECSPSKDHQNTNISDEISSSPTDCDTKCVQRRRSSLTQISLFSSGGLQDYLAGSKALCDRSNCDSDDEKASDAMEDKSCMGSEAKEDNSDSETHKASDFVDISADRDEKKGEISVVEGEKVKVSEKPEVKASETFQSVMNADVNVTSNFQSNCDQSNNIDSTKGSMENIDSKNEIDSKLCSSNCDTQVIDGSLKITDLANGVNEMSLQESQRDFPLQNGTIPSQIQSESRIDEEDVFKNMTNFEDNVKDGVKTPQKEEQDMDVSFPDPKLSLDEDIDLSKYIGPNPCTILQALTMSNANDFFSLERLETIGDSFLKYAITVHLYCTYPGIHEGKLSYLRSKQVSNCNLYRLGKRKGLAECMISTKFEPYENWLPPGYVINDAKRKGTTPKVLLVRNSYGHLEKVNDQALIDSYIVEDSSLVWTPKITEIPDTNLSKDKNQKMSKSNKEDNDTKLNRQESDFDKELEELSALQLDVQQEECSTAGQTLIAYSLQTLHSIPDKSIADCVESLIGCYLTSCGKKAALQFMHWLGLKVLAPKKVAPLGDDSGVRAQI